MNKQRRKNLREIIDKLYRLKDYCEELMSEEEDYRDNIPENLQGSERCEAADNACGELSEAIDNLEYAISSIEAAIK